MHSVHQEHIGKFVFFSFSEMVIEYTYELVYLSFSHLPVISAKSESNLYYLSYLLQCSADVLDVNVITVDLDGGCLTVPVNMTIHEVGLCN